MHVSSLFSILIGVIEERIFGRYANVTLGLPCILERTTYNGYNNPNNLNHETHRHYNVTISRDNCVSSRPKLYCSAKSLLCEKMKELEEGCESDRECISVSPIYP